MTTGSALSAETAADRSKPIPDPRNIPPNSASTAAIAHERANTDRTDTPWVSATSWSNAAARIASPIREYLKKASSRLTNTTTVMIAAIWRWAMVTPPTSTVFSPHGSPICRISTPIRSRAMIVITVLRPIVTIATANTGFPTIGRSVVRSMMIPVIAAKIAPTRMANSNGQPHTVPK